jgi:hypothetical protein
LVKCPKCSVPYKLTKCDYEQYGIVMRNIPCFKCPKCGDEIFFLNRLGSSEKRSSNSSHRLK